jgi:hypothetical protein
MYLFLLGRCDCEYFSAQDKSKPSNDRACKHIVALLLWRADKARCTATVPAAAGVSIDVFILF